jgi:hypothetical protein
MESPLQLLSTLHPNYIHRLNIRGAALFCVRLSKRESLSWNNFVEQDKMSEYQMQVMDSESFAPAKNSVN